MDVNLNETPTRPARMPGDNPHRGRALSRSSSVPSMIQHANKQNNQVDQSISPNPFHENTNNHVATRHNTSSVKHLTCFWWKEKGSCRFSDNDCLYAHHDTGHYTDPPRQLIPGEPAMAGRKLDRAMRGLALVAHRSSASLNSMTSSRHPSRPSTPNVADPSLASFSSPLTSPLQGPPQTHFNAELDLARLNSDNQFLRGLVDQNSKEKGIMITTIESLQIDNKGMKGELEGLRKAQEQLLSEREGLHKRIRLLEEGQSHNLGPPRSVSSPFGAIGRNRINTEARYIGGLLADD